MKTKTSLGVLSFIALFLEACSFQPVTQPNQGGEGGLETQASEWVYVGTPLRVGDRNTMALDSSGNPVVSGFKWEGTGGKSSVTRWNGTSWVHLTLAGSEPINTALDSSDNPVTIWYSCYHFHPLDDPNGQCQGYSFNVYRWNGSDWVAFSNQASFLYTPGSSTSLALDSSGNPVVSWGAGNIYVRRFNGSIWVQLGSSLDANTNQNALNPSLTLDSSGNPVVGWNEWDGTSYNIYVKRWNGSSWVQLAGTLDVNTDQYVYNPGLALDNSGNPVVGWNEWDGNSDTFYVKRYTTNIYLPVGETLDSSSSVSSTSPSLARRSDNKAVVAYLESNNTAHQLLVKQWDGSNWQGLGSTLNVNAQNAALNPDLKLQSNNNPTVSFEENGNIYVKSWNGSSWQQLGTSLDTLETNLAESPSLALQRLSANLNRPVVAWSELAGSGKGDYNLYVKRWDGSNWVQLGSAIDVISTQGAREPALALLSNDTPVVAWQEFDGVSTNIYVKRWNGTAWVQLGNALDTALANGAVTPTLAVASDNKVFVGWVENVSSTNSNIYAKYWNGTSWLSLGTIFDNNAAATVSAPSMAMNSSNRPVLSWSEVSGSSTDVLVKTWNGSTWVQTGPILDRVASRNASKPSLVLSTGNLPMVAWQEEIAAANWDVFVSSY